MLQKGTQADLTRAKYQFQNVLETQPDSIPALLGSANIAFQNKEYREALDLYRKVCVCVWVHGCVCVCG